MKEMLLESIKSKLSQIGIDLTATADTDVKIDKEFVDAKWSTGDKKIEFHALAYLNEEEKTLFYYETTKDTKSGFSFGSDSESSFQSGMTLMRKVKSTGFGPDGKAFEYIIDLGAITKVFKDTAKENGWKFKVVLNKNKAMYPANKEKVAKTVVVPIKNVQENKKEMKPKVEQVENTNTSKNKFKIPFIATAVIYALLMLAMEVGFWGWLFSIIIFVLIYKKQAKFLTFSLMKTIIIWAVLLISLFIFLVIISPSDSANNEKETMKLDFETKSTFVGQKEKEGEIIPYKISHYYATAIPTFEDVDPRSMDGISRLNPQIWYLVNIDIQYDVNNKEEKPKKIKLVDAKFVQKPKVGKYNIIAMWDGKMENRKEYIEKYELKNGEYEYNKDMFGQTLDSGFYVLSFGVWIYDTKVYTYPTSTKSISGDKVITDAGYTSDDVRTKVAATIEITTESGKVYYMPIEIELLKGNFLEDGKLLNDTRFQTNEYISLFEK